MIFRSLIFRTFLLFVLLSSIFFIGCNNNVHNADVYVKKEVPIVSGDFKTVYDVNADLSKIKWIGGLKYASIEHYGTIKIKKGQIHLDGEIILDANIIFDLKSITDLDITDSKQNLELVNHLKSKDFFNADSCAEAILTINRIQYPATEESTKETNCTVFGDLTMNGKKEAIEFHVSYEISNEQLVLKGQIQIDRNKWHISYANASITNILKDKIIDDLITIQIDLTAIKN